jgi:hypothetical protein
LAKAAGDPLLTFIALDHPTIDCRDRCSRWDRLEMWGRRSDAVLAKPSLYALQATPITTPYAVDWMYERSSGMVS